MKMARRGSDWTTRDEQLIERHYPEHGPSWDGWEKLLPNRTPNAISNRAYRLGVRCLYRGPKSWTKAEDRMAVAMLADVCRSLNRTPIAVIRRLMWLVERNRRSRNEQRAG